MTRRTGRSHSPTARGRAHLRAHLHLKLCGDPPVTLQPLMVFYPCRLRRPGQSGDLGLLVGVLGPATLAVCVGTIRVLIVAVGPTVTAQVPGAGIQATARQIKVLG